MADPLIERAVAILRAGGLVAFPTETVYGLGADADNSTAVRTIYAAKGRPADHPVIVHVRGVGDLERWARAVPAAARTLAERFWPGPLTLIVPKASSVPDVVTGGHDTVGLRSPAHPLARALLHAFGSGIAAPSANRFGRVSPTRAEHVRAELGDRVDLILDGGPCEVGVESTIIDLAGPEPLIVRPGGIRPAELSAALGRPVRVAEHAPHAAPGTLESHYAPATPLRLVGPAEIARAGPRSATLRTAGADPVAFARDLYARLRELDAAGFEEILVERPPEGEAWLAVRDRLKRAARRET